MTNHHRLAVGHVEAAAIARDSLTKLYREDPRERDARDVAAWNGLLGDSLKLAEIHALLSISDTLQTLALNR